MKKERVVLYARITKESDRWITNEAKRQGISKNDVVQMLVNKAMENDNPR